MNNDDIFGNSGSDHTQIFPMPGGNREDAQRKLQEEQARRPHVPADIPQGNNTTFHSRSDSRTLVDAATNLLLLIAHVSNTLDARDTRALKQQVSEEVNHFVSQTKRMGIDSQTTRDATYILCTAVDEAVLNTPWGQQSDWSMNTLLSNFFEDVRGGQIFFEKMRSLGEDPSRNHQILKLMYYCLALGYQGRYRAENDSTGKLNQVRQWLGERIRQYSNTNNRTDLSPHWKGVTGLGFSLKDFLPTWLVASIAAVLLASIFTTFLLMLNTGSSDVIAKLQKIDFIGTAIAKEPTNILAPPASKPLIVDGLSIVSTASDATIDIPGDTLFASGKANVKESFKAVLEDLAHKLNSTSGQITITGHSDSDRLSTRLKTKYGSNQGLSERRAENVASVIRKILEDNSRIVTEGAGDTQPVSKTDKAKNRRVEIKIDY